MAGVRRAENLGGKNPRMNAHADALPPEQQEVLRQLGLGVLPPV